MAKSKSILPLSGKLGDQVHVDSKYGPTVRTAPKGGRRKNQPAFNEQSNRTGYLNTLGSELNRIIQAHSGNFKQSNFYNLLQKRFRKEPLNNRLLLLKQLEGMEVNAKYPLYKLSGTKMTVRNNRNKIIVALEVDYGPPALIAKHRVNCYAYEVLLLCWVKDKEAASLSRQYGEWISLKDGLPEFEFEFKRPVDTVEWLVCLRQQVGYNEEAIPAFVGEGMQLVLAGSFDKKDMELFEERKAEKAMKEKSIGEKKKEDVVRVKAKVKRRG